MSKLWKRGLCLLVCMAIVLSNFPSVVFDAAAASSDTNIIAFNKVSDPSSHDWETYFGPQKMDTEFAGGVWTDKSVFTGVTDKLPGVTMEDSDNFLIALSAIASNMSITGYSAPPTDTMLVLDVSGSMINGTYSPGYSRSGNRYSQVTAINMSLIEAMVNATNSTIDKLMKMNNNNRVGVVLYSGNTSTDNPAAPSSATVMLPLDHYISVDGQYLAIDTDYVTRTLYQRVGNRYGQAASVTYVEENTNVDIQVRSGVQTETGAAVSATSKRVVGGTYIQNGLYKAMKEFLAVTDTTVPQDRPQAGVERHPVLVLMSDGAPTICTNDYSGTGGTDADIGNSNYGNGASNQDGNKLNRIAVMTQLTAAYVRGKVSAHYQEGNDDQEDFTFLTLGLGTSADATATATLHPSGSSTNIKNIWTQYIAAANNQNVTLSGAGFDGSTTVRRYNEVADLNYVDKYFYAGNADNLLDAFNQIVSEIELKSESYATLVEGDSANLSGYVTFEDELGEMMYVADMKGFLMSDGKGDKVLYTGKGLAEKMTNGELMGTVDDPTERGNELVRTVRERIPGLDTSMAQRLIEAAFNDQQLYYHDANNWSNYIGWYADADGNYVGFWDKESGFDNAPAGAVYANRSYGYLGAYEDTDTMHVVVQVRTELKSLHQVVYFKIPASLLPTVKYRVTINEEDPTKVDEFVREDAIPMQLVYEVGLRPDINSVNLEQKIEEHLAKDEHNHVHRNNDGTVTFYTNEWAVGNDTNNNGIPDKNEVETARVAESHFHPARDNSRYYYTEDTPILDASGNPVGGATRPSGTYYHGRQIYNQERITTITVPVAADTLREDARYDAANDLWYIPKGTIFSEVSRFVTSKVANPTGTLYYADYPAVFENGDKQDVYAFLGNNGSLTVAPAQGIKLTKNVTEVNPDPEAPTSFIFKVKLSQAVDSPLITDTDGNVLTGISSVSGDEITVRLTAGQTVVISGIPTGTTYTVTEEATSYYRAASANATGTVEAYKMHAVNFVNTAKHYGNLIVGKDVNYPQGFVPSTTHAAKEFSVHVTFTGNTENMVVPQGAVKNENTYTLKLCGGQSVTFANIPEGVTYTVTEDNLPSGYTMNRIDYSDANKAIDGNDTDTVDVVNNYSLQPVSPNAVLRGDKTLVTNEGSWNGATFTVDLLQLEDFSDEDHTDPIATAVMTESKPYYEFDLRTIPFNHAGIYYFLVMERVPDPHTDNIAYDRTTGLFAVTVGDADADGSLEVQDIRGHQATTVTGNNTSGWVVEKDFTNVVTTDRIYINIQKNVSNGTTLLERHRGDMTFGLFTSMDPQVDATPDYYALTNTQGQATIMVPVTKEMLDDNGGQLSYYMREIAPAVEDRVVGMNYDESWIYAISITWDAVNNKAVAQYAPITNNQIGQYQDYTDGSFVFNHTNIYQEVDVKLTLSGSKTLNGGNDLGDREFSFGLHHATAAFVKGDRIQKVENEGNSIAFSPVSFREPGIYYLVAQEEASTLGGITIDPTVYHITVEVEKYVDTDGTTKLRFVDGYPIVVPFGTSEAVDTDELDFNNTYTVTGSEDVIIKGLKNLSGKLLNADAFQIGLYTDSDCQNLKESVSNLANGTFAFSKITYTAEDLGPGYASKNVTYYVKEIVPTGAQRNAQTGKYELNGVAYDNTVYVITSKVSHDGAGKLTVRTNVSIQGGRDLGTAQDNLVQLQIKNVYKAKAVDVTLKGSKHLTGDWSAVVDKTFNFQLLKADAHFNITDTDPVRTATVDGQGNFSMNLHYTDGQEAIYYYVLRERFENVANGIHYDAGEYHVTVNVADSGDGALHAIVTMYRPGLGNADVAAFTNSYMVEPTKITLTGNKTYINSVTQDPMTMTEGMFTFSVLENGSEVATGINKADGTIQFTDIHYTIPGIHTYTIVENVGDEGGVTYDSTHFTATVTVEDNGYGKLIASVVYSTPVVFVNSYTSKAAQVVFNGKKILTGDWNAVIEDNKTFLFELYETDAQYTISGEPVDFVQSGEGDFSFGTRTFTEEDVYYFAIREVDDGINGIDYAEKIYHVAVTVTDGGAGQLIPTVTFSNATLTVTTDSQNAGRITVSDLSFSNHYAAQSASYELEVQKSYTGDQMREFFFKLTADGNPSQIKPNDLTTGKVVFDPLYFSAVGTYDVTVREQIPVLLDWIRWDVNVYTITLHVEDDGLGQLFVNEDKTTVTSVKGDGNLIFRNVHHNVITKKDVFIAAEPTVSIDGKTVEMNDVLLYKISYKNYDTVPVDIKIRDVIPQHTTYVAGSADNGGLLDGDTLTWEILNIAPDATVTVSFQVKVADTNATVVNGATILEGDNVYQTNEVRNSVKEDLFVKDVFRTASPTVSLDGKKVNVGETLLYKITYTNVDGFAATVTITDVIPQHTAYVDDSADNGGLFDQGKLTWTLTLEAGESKTVSFRVNVLDTLTPITNQAIAQEGNNQLTSNQVVTSVDVPPMTPQTGDNFNVALLIALFFVSGGALFTLIVADKKKIVSR